MKEVQNKTPAVIYARYSSENQRQESIEGQLRECRLFAERNNYEIIAEYTDQALTGRTDRRPGFQAMIREADKKTFKAVIVWKLDRFARNRYDSATYRAKLKKNDISVVSAKESIPEGAEGIIVEAMMEGMAEYYSANLAENVRRGLYDNALQRKTIGGQMPLGLTRGEDGTYAIVPEEAETVRKIFEDYAAGIPTRQIVDELNRAGYRTAKGSKFRTGAIRHIIQNEKYIGVYRYGDIMDPEGIPAIIDKELYTKANRNMSTKKRTRSNRTSTYLLSGLLYCGACGCAYNGEYAISKTGARHEYYFCAGAKRHECDTKRIRADWIEKIVKDELSYLLDSREFFDFICELILHPSAELMTAQDAEIERITRELEERRVNYQNLLKAVENGLYTPKIKDRMIELEGEISDLEDRHAELMLQYEPITLEDIELSFDVLRKKRSESPLDWRTILDILVSRIYLYDDRLEILLNYGSRNKVTLKFDEKEKAEPGESSTVRAMADHVNACLELRHGVPVLILYT